MIQQLKIEQSAQIGGGVNLTSMVTATLGMSIGIFIDLVKFKHAYDDLKATNGAQYKVLQGRSLWGILGAVGGFVLGELLAN